MDKRGIVFVASIALLALSGCAMQQRTNAVARLTESDVRPSAVSTDLVGTWSGSFGPVAADAGGSNAIGNVTLEIKDDGTYTLTERRGASTRNYSGVVVANGRTITLRSSSGTWVSLRRRGDVLYGVARDRMSGYALQISAEKNSGAPAGSHQHRAVDRETGGEASDAPESTSRSDVLGACGRASVAAIPVSRASAAPRCRGR